LTILTSVTLASTNNPLPEDGVTAWKHVGIILMYILILFFKTITCTLVQSNQSLVESKTLIAKLFHLSPKTYIQTTIKSVKHSTGFEELNYLFSAFT
jgi:hypothetical protein